MDFTEFYDESNLNMFPAKPSVIDQSNKVINISLNFIFYILIYLFFFNGNFKLLAAVLMVIFIHESGHMLLMKRYGYSDKKMFLIPFMNLLLKREAVQINLSQKLIILLMGPLPGILIGFTIFFIGKNTLNGDLINLAWIFITWNLINLIPIESLDGAHLSTVLYFKNNYTIQLITTILASTLIAAVAILFKNYFILIIPVFLFFRLKGLNSMKELRQKLQEKGIDCRLGFEELNNKQYWMLRKGLNEINQLPINEENVNEFTESIYEKLIVQNMKLVLVDLPYDNLSKKKKLIFTVFWVLIFIIPISILISLIYSK